VSSDRFSATLHFLQRHKRIFLASVIGLLLLSAAGVFTVPLQHSLLLMLPKDSESRRMISFLEDLDFSGKVILSISQDDGSLSRTEFLAQVDAFAGALKPPLVTKAVSRMDDRQLIGDMQFFLQQAPGLLDADDFQTLEKKLTPGGVEQMLRSKYLQLMKPEGSFMAEMIRRDPLDIQAGLIERIRNLSASFGYTMKIEDQHIFSADGKHLLLILETPVRFTDSKGSRELMAYLERNQKQYISPSIQVDTVCAHLHSLGNEAIIKRDIGWTLSITGIAFILLFLFYFKDPRAGLIFAIPFAGVLVAISPSALFMGALSPMILGFGSVLAGISVDYGIHVYIAVRRGTSAVASVRAIVRPLVLGALTTSAVFAGFFFTRIEGYQQLACLALISILVALAAAIFVLPLLIKPARMPEIRRPHLVSRISYPASRLTAAVFILLMLGSIPLAMRIHFDGDIARLDGSGRKVFETEERFRTVWGGGEQGQAILAVSGPDYETALEQNDLFYNAAVRQVGRESLSSFSAIWKSAAQQTENFNRWKQFWDSGRRDALQRILSEKGQPFGFASDAFKPFFEQMEAPFVPAEKPSGNLLFDQLQSRFVQQKNGLTQVFTFFPDTPEMVAAITPLAEQTPGAQLVSRRALALSLKTDYTAEMSRIAVMAAVFMLTAAFVMLKNVRMALIALAPAGAGVMGMLAFMGLLHIDMNVVNLIAAVVVIGLCIDYGIYYTHAYAHRLDVGTSEAIALSAGATLLDACALLFARHPALFSIGLTLVSGVLAGYLTALLAVPALCRVFLGKRGVE
jgi:predicted exporter